LGRAGVDGDGRLPQSAEVRAEVCAHLLGKRVVDEDPHGIHAFHSVADPGR
jgi:hypothetical protein